MTYVPRQIPTKVANPELQRYLEQELIDIARLVNALEAASTGVGQLSDLSDVNTSTPTNRNVLVADGTDWESRALVEADISDFGSYALASHNHSGVYSPVGHTHVTADITDIPAYNVFTGGAIVTRHSSGYIFSNYFNQSISSSTTGSPTHVPVCTGSDGYFRWQTVANFFDELNPRYASEMSASINLNNLQASSAGFHYQTANADTPGNNYPNGLAGSLLVQKSAGQCTQFYITYDGTPQAFIRTYYTSWGSWYELLFKNTASTISGAYTYSSNPKRSSQGGYIHHNSSSYTDGGVTFSTGSPSGGTTGDIWFKYA